MAELQTYYYFYQGRVVTSHAKINNRTFEELTENEVLFYSQNQAASVVEIKNCQLLVAPVDSVVDIEYYRAKKLDELHQLSLSTSNAVVAGWQITDALLPGVYDAAKKEATLTKAADIANQCIAEYYRVETLILAAETIEDIDTAFNSNTYSEMQ